MKKTYYDILGIKQSATQAEIKTAYRKKALEAHPDRGGSNAKMALVNKAYQMLKVPSTRAAYDQRVHDYMARQSGAQNGTTNPFSYTRTYRGYGNNINVDLNDILKQAMAAREAAEREQKKYEWEAIQNQARAQKKWMEEIEKMREEQRREKIRMAREMAEEKKDELKKKRWFS